MKSKTIILVPRLENNVLMWIDAEISKKSHASLKAVTKKSGIYNVLHFYLRLSWLSCQLVNFETTIILGRKINVNWLII